jgi:hypothetical protein
MSKLKVHVSSQGRQSVKASDVVRGLQESGTFDKLAKVPIQPLPPLDGAALRARLAQAEGLLREGAPEWCDYQRTARAGSGECDCRACRVASYFTTPPVEEPAK